MQDAVIAGTLKLFLKPRFAITTKVSGKSTWKIKSLKSLQILHEKLPSSFSLVLLMHSNPLKKALPNQ
jgi:hypothetical protein